jgi:hypothetical protein
MDDPGDRAIMMIARAGDAVVAALSAMWPLSLARQEIERLVRDGYAAGAPCEMAFSLAFTEADDLARALAAAVRSGHRVVTDDGASRRGFITVYARIRLTAFDLSLAMSWLVRMARGCRGFAALIGPVTATLRNPGGSTSAAAA